MEKKVSINANLEIWVKLKDLGIEHYVRNHNRIMPFQMQISFKDYKSRANEFGYHKFQIWTFLSEFGNLDMSSANYFHLDFVFNKTDFKEFNLDNN